MTIDSTVEPWMSELWAWADKFEIREDHLPRNIDDLNALTKLDLRKKGLIGPEKNITQILIYLNNLKNLKTLRMAFYDENDISKLLQKINYDIELDFYSNQEELPESLLAHLKNIKTL